jgi:predicted O-methyltransferase YrrM
MKKLPEIIHHWGDLYTIVRNSIPSTILIKAIKWKIFDYLTEAVSAQEVAAHLKSHPRNTELFLNSLAGMGLIKKEMGLFQNTEKGLEFLVSASPKYLGAFFLHVNEWHENLAPNIETLVEKGPPEQNQMNMSDGTLWAKSAGCSAAYQYCGEAQHIARIISALPEFRKMKKMLDLGGGAGFFTMAIVEAHPDMQGVIFEQPAVAAVARGFTKEYEMDQRVSIIEGDYNKDDLGNSYDFIFAGATLNFGKHNLDGLFKRVYNSLNPGGVFMTHQDGITDERTKPVSHVTEFLSAELMGMDFAITQGEIAEAMLRCGFKSVRSFTKYSDIGDMDIDIGRK